MNEKSIMTPEHPHFYPILHGNLPTGWKKEASGSFSGVFGVSNETGLLTPLSENEFEEYAWGGEMDEVNSQYESDDYWNYVETEYFDN
jgi:hypothetical protein